MANEHTAQVNPAALGLASFGLTTVLLSLINAGLLPAGGEPVEPAANDAAITP